uniref:TRAP transporter substrate-binding protein n=1 Tax=Ignisphaera aggregans TaxID=334771 RepID=A0A7C2VL00_9CREN
MSPVSSTTWAAIVVVIAIIAGLAGYFAGSSAAPVTTVTKTVTTTVGGAGATVTVTTTVGGAPAEPEFVLHAAYLTQPNPYDTHHIFFYLFEELVEKRTNGRVDIVLHPGGELGDQARYLELMATGDLFIATIEVSRFAAYTDKLMFMAMPGMFKNTHEAMAFSEWDWILDYSNQVLNEFGWEVLGITVGGARYFVSVPDKPITSLESFKGMVIRVQNVEVQIRGIEVLGGTPSTLAYGECYTGLQTRTIDAMENEIGTIISMRFYEPAPNIALIPWIYTWHFIVASKQVLDSLPGDIRQIIIDTAREITRIKNEHALYVEEVIGPQYLAEHGARIIKLPESELNRIMQKFEQELHPQYAHLIPPEVKEWLQQYRSGLSA